MIGAELPDYVPARMVNEFAYCPRLFHLEWVSTQWADNVETDQGRWHHRSVDRAAGRVPAPSSDDEAPRVARSVSLSSERLGLTAVIDVLETADGRVVPIDTKRGAPPDIPERAWEPERVQVCVQAILLREAGYQCDEAVLYFADARQRVTVPIDTALVARTLELILGLRRAATSETPPPPLVDSPKCPRCSLVGICLPDEVNLLADRTDRAPRRLVPSATAARPVYVVEQGTYLGKEGDRLEIRRGREVVETVRFIDVSQVCVFGNVQIGTQLLRSLFDRDVPVAWFSFGGWLAGVAEGHSSKHVQLRRRQVLADVRGEGLDIARRMIYGKIRNSRVLLRRNARHADVSAAVATLADAARGAAQAESVSTLLGIEGAAARTYFGSFSTMLRSDLRLPGGPFTFDGRHRRPATDPVNALLGFVYGLLTKDLTITSRLVGFDPYQGMLHRPRFGRPALALDLAEEFRPLVAESVVLQVINNGEITPRDFVERAGAVALTPSGRRTVLRAYERRLDHEITHPTFRYRISYRRALEVQARVLAATLLGEVDHYEPLVTR